MYNLGSPPEFRGKAHNCLVLCRFLSCKSAESQHTSHYAFVRHVVLWAWCELFDVHSHSVNPNWMSDAEIARSTVACRAILHGSNYLCQTNQAAGKSFWKIRPKMHRIFHVMIDTETSRRPMKAWWSFKCEDNMGRLSRIGISTHAATIADRSLQRWQIQFFSWVSKF